jgi:hypothetical protein
MNVVSAHVNGTEAPSACGANSSDRILHDLAMRCPESHPLIGQSLLGKLPAPGIRPEDERPEGVVNSIHGPAVIAV